MTLTTPGRPRQAARSSSAVVATIRWTGYWAATLVVLAGCTTRWAVQEHESRVMPTAGRATYYWQGGTLRTTDAIDLSDVLAVRDQIEALITATLAVKGYQKVASDDAAAMIVSYAAQLGPPTFTSEKPAVTRWPGSGASTPASELPQKRMTMKNHVVVVIEDPQTRHVIWHGVVDDDVRVSSTRHAIELAAAMAGDIARRIPQCRPGTPAGEARP